MSGHSRYRNTVYGALRDALGPLSATDLHEQLCGTGIGIATIYRILKKGVEDGELIPIELPGGPKRFATADKPHHHHFECVQCHAVFNVMGSLGGLDHLVPEGFELEQHEIILSGRCRECANTTNRVE